MTMTDQEWADLASAYEQACGEPLPTQPPMDYGHWTIAPKTWHAMPKLPWHAASTLTGVRSWAPRCTSATALMSMASPVPCLDRALIPSGA